MSFGPGIPTHSHHDPRHHRYSLFSQHLVLDEEPLSLRLDPAEKRHWDLPTKLHAIPRGEENLTAALAKASLITAPGDPSWEALWKLKELGCPMTEKDTDGRTAAHLAVHPRRL